jgi:bifunctional DNA-binding transcriptional regulator/antitoxin component of YhaV-PrlF toxin-antitoxin module
MRMTSRGRVTIPIATREKAGLLPNTKVEVDYDGDYVASAARVARKGRTAAKSLLTVCVVATTCR